MRKRSSVVTLTLVAAMAASCGQDGDGAQVCVDQMTGVRVEDDQCKDDGSGHGHFYYIPHGSGAAPAVGKPVSGGSYGKPAGSFYSVPRSGGFGTHGGTGGG